MNSNIPNRARIQSFQYKLLDAVIINPQFVYLVAEMSIVIFVFMQLHYIHLYDKFNIILVYVPVIAYCVYRLIKSIYLRYSYSIAFDDILSKNQINPIINWIGIIIYICLVLIKIHIPKVNALLLNIPITIVIFIKMFYVHYFWDELTDPKNILFNTSAYSFALLNVFISVRLEGIAKFDWPVVFWYLLS